MKKERIVLSSSCLPTRSPLLFLIVIALLMERGAGVPGWAWGVYWTVAFVSMVMYIVMTLQEEYTIPQGYGSQK